VIFLVLVLGGWYSSSAVFPLLGFWSIMVWAVVTGFFAISSIPGIVAEGQSKIYNLTKPLDKTAKQVIEDEYYLKNKDTIKTDIIVFGHTHFAGSYELKSEKGEKLFINSGCWTGSDTNINGEMRYANTFIYIDEGGAYIMKWLGPDNIKCIEVFAGG
jgi:hypothetical protein